MTGATEKQLDLAFQHAIENSQIFFGWVLDRTKFAGSSSKIALLRSNYVWHKSNETGIESETDILLVCEEHTSGRRFALHFENKLANGHFTPNQPEQYAIRAKEWMHTPKYENYSDFETVLSAPKLFYERNSVGCQYFNRYISHEDIAEFIPEFVQA